MMDKLSIALISHPFCKEFANSKQDVAINPDINATTDEQRVIIIDGMAVANQINKTKEIKSCTVSNISLNR